MDWLIEGADAGSGDEVSLRLDADSSDEAEALARQRGILISRVSAASSADEEASRDLAHALTLQAAPAPVSYAGPMQKLPEYTGLRIGAIALRGAAVLWYLIGGLTLIQFAWTLVTTSWSGGWRPWGFGEALQAMNTLLPLTIGIIFHVVAEGCNALRDIARNSFRD
jgi:hypothetical protein